MQKLVPLTLTIAILIGNSCSSSSLHGARDASPEVGPPACAGLPPETCGFLCQDGQWVRTTMPCLTPDGAISDAVVHADAAVTSTGGATGGATATGGTAATGGATAAGGTTTTGGKTATGGATVMGGSTGGKTATGGVTANGGKTATGGATATAGTSATGGRTVAGGSRAPGDGGVCAELAGKWLLTGSCMGPYATFNGSFPAVMTQTGCDLTFTANDEQGDELISTGRLESTGRGFLKGEFHFTDSRMCDLTVTGEGWDMICASATQSCKLQARQLSDPI